MAQHAQKPPNVRSVGVQLTKDRALRDGQEAAARREAAALKWWEAGAPARAARFAADAEAEERSVRKTLDEDLDFCEREAARILPNGLPPNLPEDKTKRLAILRAHLIRRLSGKESGYEATRNVAHALKHFWSDFSGEFRKYAKKYPDLRLGEIKEDFFYEKLGRPLEDVAIDGTMTAEEAGRVRFILHTMSQMELFTLTMWPDNWKDYISDVVGDQRTEYKEMMARNMFWTHLEDAVSVTYPETDKYTRHY